MNQPLTDTVGTLSIRLFWAIVISLVLPAIDRGLEAREPRSRFHCVLIVADDLRAGVTSVYGGPVQTPNLEKLAEKGVRASRNQTLSGGRSRERRFRQVNERSYR